MSWKDMMPVQPMVAMLESSFFPKWQQVLVAWLSNMPNYQDITKWYLGWKAQFPEILLGHPSVKGLGFLLVNDPYATVHIQL